MGVIWGIHFGYILEKENGNYYLGPRASGNNDFGLGCCVRRLRASLEKYV